MTINHLFIILKALQQYYIMPPLIEPDQQPFPYIDSFLFDDEVCVYFKYQTRLNPLVFVVQVVKDAPENFPEYVVVKLMVLLFGFLKVSD